MDDPPSESIFAEMKRYVRFSDEDARALVAFGPAAAPHFERIAAEFYERVREHEEAHAVFTGEAQIARLQLSLVRWMERLVRGPYDEDYYAERARIGRAHVRIGLPQRYMFTAMALIRGSFEELAEGLHPGEARAVRRALARVLDLELAIMLETYREDHAARLERIARAESDRLRSELARSEQRAAGAVELARVMVVGVDATGAIVLFNHEAERVTGHARDQALGRSFVELLLPEGLRATEGDQLHNLVPAATWEVPVLTRSGRERLVRWLLSPVPPSADDSVVLYAVGRDVTEEQVLRDQTRQSERLAAVGTLAAGLAHEIRNPLNGALLHVTFLERALKRSRVDADALEAARVIGVEIQRLSSLVRDFLVFARPAPPERRPCSLSELCRHASTLVADDAARASASLSLDLPVADLTLRIDPAKIEQVLLNLLRNAFDAVGSGSGASVTVRVRREPRHALVEVEDDGPGLPSPDAPIFDAFYTTRPHGTGLGLAIVHRAVDDHGGSVEVDSRPGRTVFRVRLPITPDATSAST